jgi:L-ascorbate metabolism protein UlaG (beta-lactamase superfamily)
MRLTFAGHSTVLIELDGMRILTDPIFRRRFVHVVRRTPPPDSAHLEDVDLVLISHVHHDHLDRPSLRKLDGDPTVVVPRGAGRFLPRLKKGRVEEVVEGQSLSLGGIEIEATHADHRPGRIRHRGPAAIGFTVTGSKRAYFAGDTDLFPGMRELGAGGIDVALLPVWGWGTKLGSGHLDPRRAAEALELLRPRVAIPIHWGTFHVGLRRPRHGPLTEPSRAFAREAARRAPDVQVRILTPGEATVVE